MKTISDESLYTVLFLLVTLLVLELTRLLKPTGMTPGANAARGSAPNAPRPDISAAAAVIIIIIIIIIIILWPRNAS